MAIHIHSNGVEDAWEVMEIHHMACSRALVSIETMAPVLHDYELDA
jgi:hypothetical protein